MARKPRVKRNQEDRETGALAGFLEEMRRHPILDRDEEQALARRYRATGDVEAAHRLVNANLRLVVKLAREYARSGVPLVDLIQEGNVGLVRSLARFEPERGLRLTTYAAFWIRAYMLKYLLDNLRLVRFAKTPAQRKLYFNLRREQRRLEIAGITPTPEAIAERLDVPAADVVDMQTRLAQPEASLEEPIDLESGSSPSRLDLLEGPAEERPDNVVEEAEVRGVVRLALERFGRGLSGRDQIIFDRRIAAETPRPLSEVAGELGLSRERVRQLERKLLGRLRTQLEPELGVTALAA